MRSKYKELIPEWIDKYKNGMSIREIAEEYNVNKGTIANQIRKHVDIRPRTQECSKETEKEICSLYLSGENPYSLSKKFALPYSKVNKILMNNNIFESSNLQFTHLIDSFKKDYSNGDSLSVIAKRYNISVSTVEKYLNIIDVDRRSYSEASRKYEFNEQYFDELNYKKEYELGLIFAAGNTYVRNTSKELILVLKEMTIKNGLTFFEYCKRLGGLERSTPFNHNSSSLKITIPSMYLCTRLEELGIRDNIINFLYNSYNFWEGIFDYSITVYNSYLYFSIKKENIFNALIRYLKDNFNIKINDKNICGNSKYSFTIYSRNDIINLAKKHEIIKKKIIDFINDEQKYKDSPKWKFIKNSLNIEKV